MAFKQVMKMFHGEKFGGIREWSFANDLSVPLPLIILLSWFSSLSELVTIL